MVVSMIGAINSIVACKWGRLHFTKIGVNLIQQTGDRISGPPTVHGWLFRC